MPQARLIIKKRPRGEYEIGTYTEDGSIVAHVSLRDGGASDARTEAEREDAALEQVTRLRRSLRAGAGGGIGNRVRIPKRRRQMRPRTR